MSNPITKIALKLIALLMFCIITNYVVIAQKPKFKFKSINQQEGLINSTVQAIFEDSFGFIWLGSHNGVQRFDGKTYKNFEHDDNDTTGLSHNYVSSFCEDVTNNIWIATSGGINKYDRKNDKIERHNATNKLLAENGEPYFLYVICDDINTNILWATVLDVGLVKLNIQTDSITIYSINTEFDGWGQWILPYPGNTNKLLIGGDRLLSFNKVTGQFDEIYKLRQNAEIHNNIINAAALDPSNDDIIWLATGDIWGRGNLGGLIKYNLNTGFAKHFSPKNRPEDMSDIHLLSISFYDNDNLWIGTRNHGALLYKIEEDHFYKFENNIYDNGSFITKNAVRSILVDRSNTIWFGTWGDGISLLSPIAQKFTHYKHLPGENNGPIDNYITSFAEDKVGNIWIGTKEGGLSKFNPDQKTFENYFQQFILPDNNFTEITYLFYDSRENLWIGTYDDALYRFNPVTGKKVHYTKGTSVREVTQKRITAITEFEPGKILISTYGGGLNIFDYQTNGFKHYIHNQNDSTSIPDNQIWLPFLGNDGNYYFGGNSTSLLIKFNPSTEEFSGIIPANTITSFQMPLKTSDGKIYINDVTAGLRELNLKDGITVSTIYDINGQNIKNVESVLSDIENKIWMGTGNGLVEYDPDKRISKRYNEDDGLQGHLFNRFAALKSSTGEMYFGGKNGFNIFHPNKIEMSTFRPPIVFTDFRLFQESVIIGRKSPLKQNILLMDKLILEYDQNDFSFSFAALDFSNPQNIEYKYMLENHDPDWKNAGHNNVASYTNMDPGEYKLKVMATNGDGVWNNEVKSIKIFINPPWWLTNWAFGFYLLLLIMGILGVHKIMRTRLIRKERERSRTLELKQAKEVEKAYINLKSTQEQLIQSEKMASLGELTAGIAHEIQNPLNFVNNFSDVCVDLLEEMDEEISEGNTKEVKAIAGDLKQNLKKIHHHGGRASSIVKGMLEHSRTGDGKKEPTDINAMAEEYIRLAYHGLRAKDKSFNADFKTDLDKNLPKIKVIGQDIARVVLNVLSNAFYAVSKKAIAMEGGNYKPLVTISTKKLDNMVEIRVTDNGGGIPEEIIDKIFQPFFTTKASGEGTGLGLSLSYDIITKGHDGTLKVETTDGEGSSFIINLPIEKK